MFPLDVTITPYQFMKESLQSAQGCLREIDVALGTANWAGSGMANAVALQKAYEAKVLVCTAILAAAGLAEAEPSEASARLAKLLCSPSIQKELANLDVRWLPDDVVNFSRMHITAETPIDESNAGAKIEALKHFVGCSKRILAELLPKLVERGLEGWHVLPPEDLG